MSSRSNPKRRPTKKQPPQLKGENFTPRNQAQKDYVRAIVENDVIYCTGPAGTGKSAVAIAMACQYLMRGDFDKLIITRPCVETAKKSLGALPGGLKEKFDPWLKAAKKELKKFLGEHLYMKYTTEGNIEFLPLEYMRGETFDDAIMLLDEAQNADLEQLHMFTTRMGVGSKVLINGDINQSDNRKYTQSQYSTDLEYVIKTVENIEGFAHSTFTEDDIVRHEILKKYLRAFRN